jgi:hypothetical protein
MSATSGWRHPPLPMEGNYPRCRFLRLRALVERPQTHRPQPLRHRKPELFHDTATRIYRLHSEQPNAATVHRRFPNKTDLLIHVVESAHHELAPQPPHWRSIAEIPTGLSSSAQSVAAPAYWKATANTHWYGIRAVLEQARKSDSYSRPGPRHRPRDPLRRHAYPLPHTPKTPTVGKKLPNT